MTQTPLRVALLGCGTVGTAVAGAIVSRSALYEKRIGRRLELAGIAVRDVAKPRDLGLVSRDVLTQDPSTLIDRADIVIEVMGGIDPTQALIEQGLRAGKPVVTANKQLIAAAGPHLHAIATEHGATLDYEAAVVAAVPIVRVVRDALAGDRITSISGIVNGSTNYVLDMVARHGMGLAEAVEQAGALGYLEADPTEDLEGIDAAAKIVILARLAWGVEVTMSDVKRRGISHLSNADFEAAAGAGHVIKLLASAWASGDPDNPKIELAVRPVSLGADNPLAQTREGRNEVVIEAEFAGPLRMHGAGAGGLETASAVLGDVVNAARSISE